MPGMKIDILGVKELQAKLNKLPVEVADEAITEVQDYMLNVLRMYPPQNYVSRTEAYGKPFQTEKQRRWFFWALNSGLINVPYRRTQALSKGWHKVRSGIMGYLVNYRQGIAYVMGENKQSKHEQLVGWKKPSEIIDERMEKIKRIIDEAAKKAIRKLGL